MKWCKLCLRCLNTQPILAIPCPAHADGEIFSLDGSPAVEVSSQGVFVSYRFSDVDGVPLELEQLSPPELQKFIQVADSLEKTCLSADGELLFLQQGLA